MSYNEDVTKAANSLIRDMENISLKYDVSRRKVRDSIIDMIDVSQHRLWDDW